MTEPGEGPRTPLWRRVAGASNTFSAAQVDATIKLFRALDTPATRQLLTPELRKVQGKFLRMQSTIDKAREESGT